MRICSLLPSATEIVCALGLGGDLVGVSHECDYPPEVASLPRLTTSPIHGSEQSSAAIDAVVSAYLHEHRAIYSLDEVLLDRLKPDLILTQELCDVCAVSYEQVEFAARRLQGQHTILSLEPVSLDTVLDTIRAVGRATGREGRADELTHELREELRQIGQCTAASAVRPRVACVEWLDPPFTGGHWVPEMVRLAGGIDVLAEPGERSRRLTWEQILDARPEVLVLMPCGFEVERTLHEFERLALPPGWQRLPAVREHRVFAVNANAFFSRPGPRLVRGVEILEQILKSESELPIASTNWRRAPGR